MTRDEAFAQCSPDITDALKLAYHELKQHEADYHHRTSVEVNNKIVDALAYLQPDQARTMSQCSPDIARVRFGFASYKGGRFELIAINIETGEEVTLEGQLRPDQTLEQIDKVLPTCVYVNAVAATPGDERCSPDIERLLEQIADCDNPEMMRGKARQALSALRAQAAPLRGRGRDNETAA